MQAQKLEGYRKALLSLRERVGGEVNHVVESIQEDVHVPGDISAAPVHMADVAVESVDADMEVLNTARSIFEEVNVALERIAAGTFGKCESCGATISEERLKAIPYTPYCLRCAEAKSAHEERD
jgi:RNA polymerase-binding transcription factor DksA